MAKWFPTSVIISDYNVSHSADSWLDGASQYGWKKDKAKEFLKRRKHNILPWPRQSPDVDAFELHFALKTKLEVYDKIN